MIIRNDAHHQRDISPAGRQKEEIGFQPLPLAEAKVLNQIGMELSFINNNKYREGASDAIFLSAIIYHYHGCCLSFKV